MVKRFTICLCLLVCAFVTDAQTMKWLCEPLYDTIEVLNDRLYLASKDGKYGVLNDSGEVLHDLRYDEITPFQEGRALLLREGTSGYNELVGLIDESGRLIRNFESQGIIPSFDYPFYKEGKMVYATAVKGKSGGYKFGYLDLDGRECIPAKYTYAAPFNNGKATVRMASSGTFGVINSSGTTAVFTEKPLLFLSSIVDGQAVGFRNSRNGGEMVLLKLNGEGFSVRKVLAEGYGELLFPNRNFSRLAYGRHTFEFDAALRYIGMNSSVEYSPISLPSYPERGSSTLIVTDNGTLKGIAYNGKDIVLPQFADMIPLRETIASAVNASGKAGLLVLDEDASVSFVERFREFDFRSAVQPELSWTMNVNGISPDKVTVCLKSARTGTVTDHSILTDDEGRYKVVMPFEFRSKIMDRKIDEDYEAVVYVDDIAVTAETLTLSYTYHSLLKNLIVNAPEFTESSGFAEIKVTVSTYEPLTSSGRALITLSSGESETVYLNDRSSGSFTFTVNVPEEETSTFTIEVTVSDGDACPSSSSNRSVTIKNYFLQ